MEERVSAAPVLISLLSWAVVAEGGVEDREGDSAAGGESGLLPFLGFLSDLPVSDVEDGDGGSCGNFGGKNVRRELQRGRERSVARELGASTYSM